MNAPSDDPFELERFILAQDPVLPGVLRELRAGQKTTHWMWFVFPQLRGLGQSAMARRYGISGQAEARAYLDHPTLGTRLIDAATIVTGCDRSLAEIFGAPDDRKFCSSMTLFERVAADGSVFSDALEHKCHRVRDARTLALLAGST